MAWTYENVHIKIRYNSIKFLMFLPCFDMDIVIYTDCSISRVTTLRSSIKFNFDAIVMIFCPQTQEGPGN
jgi:hypothetical protein